MKRQLGSSDASDSFKDGRADWSEPGGWLDTNGCGRDSQVFGELQYNNALGGADHHHAGDQVVRLVRHDGEVQDVAPELDPRPLLPTSVVVHP